MKHNRTRGRLALLAALALLLTLPAGCAGDGDAQQPDSAVVSGEQQEPSPTPSGSAPQETPGTAQPEASQPTDPEPEQSVPVSARPTPSAPEEPKPSESAPAQPEPSEPAQPEQSEPAALEDGSYTASVTLEGGSGRANVESPAKLRCENGELWATIVWSSSNFDYMKVDGQRYDLINTEGNSTFEIPVAALDQKLDVIADTVAMSTPHEVEYTLFFDSSTLVKV